MTPDQTDRRSFLRSLGLGAAALGARAPARARPSPEPGSLRVDPRPRFPLSPWLSMQFMEPLGVTDSSVDAAWDYVHDQWRPDLVEATRDLAPTLIRWGGCFCSYYRWREGVGPREQRVPMVNLLWGGLYSNQVGTAELVDFCRQVGADPLIVVNFEADGRKYWARSPRGEVRSAGPEEAAAWVAYCNQPDHPLRRQHGAAAPHAVRLWQIGNETSYEPDGFTRDEGARKTVEFARAMRAADPGIQLIGWGEGDWAGRMVEVAGEHLQYLAFHNGFGPGGEDSPLRGVEYRKDPDRTWAWLMDAWKAPEAHIREMRQRVAGTGMPLAITESHFALPGRNRCEVLSSWAAGVANARILNVHQRHGDVIKIATLADFCGTRWQNNAVMIPVPWGHSFLMPVAMVMRLYRRHSGEQAVEVLEAPPDLDAVASRTGDRVFLHVVNTSRREAVPAHLAVDGRSLAGGRVHTLALDPEFEIFEHRPDLTTPTEAELPAGGAWIFPPASVSAVELDLEAA